MGWERRAAAPPARLAHAGRLFAAAYPRLAALAWGPTIALAVVATGSHFMFDVVTGPVVTAAGFGVGLAAHRPIASIRVRSRSTPLPVAVSPSMAFTD